MFPKPLLPIALKTKIHLCFSCAVILSRWIGPNDSDFNLSAFLRCSIDSYTRETSCKLYGIAVAASARLTECNVLWQWCDAVLSSELWSRTKQAINRVVSAFKAIGITSLQELRHCVECLSRVHTAVYFLRGRFADVAMVRVGCAFAVQHTHCCPKETAGGTLRHTRAATCAAQCVQSNGPTDATGAAAAHGSMDCSAPLVCCVPARAAVVLIAQLQGRSASTSASVCEWHCAVIAKHCVGRGDCCSAFGAREPRAKRCRCCCVQPERTQLPAVFLCDGAPNEHALWACILLGVLGNLGDNKARVPSVPFGV